MLRTLPGIHRPAIAGFFPTLRSESVMLDLGANVECDADNLVQSEPSRQHSLDLAPIDSLMRDHHQCHVVTACHAGDLD